MPTGRKCGKGRNLPVPKVKKVALAYSGGLDSSLSIELLRRKYKAKEIVAINIDVGQGDRNRTR